MTTLRIASVPIGSPLIPELTVIEASTLLSNGQRTTSQHVLDFWLGNDDGSFSTTGLHFTFSARNVRISDDKLCADLTDIQGVAKAADIRLRAQHIQEPEGLTHCLIIGDDSDHTPQQIVPSVVLELGDICRHLRLQDRFLLLAYCKDYSTKKIQYTTPRTFNLDFCLGNRDGSFDVDGQNFSRTARKVRLENMVLSAELLAISGDWKSAEIDLQRIVCCSKGRLLAKKESRRLCSQAPSHHETTLVASTEQQLSLVGPPLYTSLEGCKNLIRVCYIENGDWSDPVRCRMVTRFIDQADDYMCLSYVWGDTQKTFTVEVNSHPVSVSENLDYALRYLRSHGTAGAIWIDALCINQDDVQERSAQVLQMAKIYATAEQVIIWLGALCTTWKSSSDLSIEIEDWALGDFFRSLANNVDIQQAAEQVARDYASREKLTAPPLDAMIVALIEAFDVFANLSWFLRTWTVQEYILASRSVFVFGSQVVSTDALVNLNTALNAFTTSFKTDSGPQNKYCDQQTRDHLDHMRTRLNQLSCLAQFSRLACSGQASSKELAMDAALVLLQLCRHRNCSDPRDKLLAFANVASDAFGSIHADYSMSATEVFTRFTLNVIQQMGNFDIWSLIRRASDYDESTKVEDLPTWVVDWTVGSAHGLKFLVSKGESPTPLRTYSSEFTVITDGNVLLVQGTQFDVVSGTTADAYNDYGAAYRLGYGGLTPWIQFLGLTGLDTGTDRPVAWDRFARLMMHDRYPVSANVREFGLPAVKNAWRIATAEDLELFYAWAAREQEYRGIHTATGVPAELQVVADLVGQVAGGLKLVRSVGDRIGLCPESAQAGDVLFHIAGSRWPVLLRPDPVETGHASHTTTYQLVGICYVTDISEDMVEQALRNAEQVRVR